MKLAARVPSKFSPGDIEAIISVFCDREECNFDPNWIYILEMLISLPCSLYQIYNMFHAINTKFIPRLVFFPEIRNDYYFLSRFI